MHSLSKAKTEFLTQVARRIVPEVDGQQLESVPCGNIFAHEIGHGVIHTTAGWHGYSDREMSLHEGFAEVFTHGVEWMAQYVTNNGVEVADWTAGEDKGSYDRRVDIDEGVLRFWRLDGDHDNNWNALGAPIPIAFRLFAGDELAPSENENPACSGLHNQPPTRVCDISVEGVGYELAFKVFFDMLKYEAQSSTGWGSLASLLFASAGKFDPPPSQVTAAMPLSVPMSDPWVRPCVEASHTQVSVWRAFAAVDYKWNIEFCGDE